MKLKSLVALGAILSLSASACGGNGGSADTVAPSTDAVPVTDVVEVTGLGGVAADEELKIAIVLISPVAAGGWSLTHDLARRDIEDRFPNVKATVVESVPFTVEATQTFERLVSEGNRMIFATSEFGDLLFDVQKRYPEVAFIQIGGFTTDTNLADIMDKHWEPWYVIGVAAGHLAKNGRLGYVGAIQSPLVTGNINAFLLGAQSVNPAATLNAIYINSFYDPQAATAAAGALIDAGAEVLGGIMDENAFMTVAEERGVWVAQWSVDVRDAAPKWYLNANVLNWSKAYIDEVQAFMDGTWTGGRTIFVGINEGNDIGEWGPNVPADVIAAAEAVRQQMIDGTFQGYSGPITDDTGSVHVAEGQTMTDDEIYRWDWFVAGVKTSG